MSEAPKWLRSRVVGSLIGLFTGGVTIMLLESFGHFLFGTVDPADTSSITGPMFASVLVAWVVGCAVAGAIATYWARATTVTLGVIVAAFFLMGAVVNMVAFPHPLWMMAAAFVLMPAAAIGSARFVADRGGR